MATKPTGGALETVIRKPVQYLMRAVRVPSNQTADCIQEQPGTFRVSVSSRLIQCIRSSWTYLLPRPRRRTGKPLIQPKNRSAIRIARAEAKDLLRLLHQSNVPADAISRVAPALTRCFAQSELMSTKIVALLLSVGAAVQYLPINIAELFLPADTTHFIGIGLLWNILYPVIVFISHIVLIKTNDDYCRLWRSSTKRTLISRALNFPNCLLTFVVFYPIYIYLLRLTSSDKSWVELSLINYYELLIVISQCLLSLAYIFSTYWLARIILRWRAPELVLVRTLADALEMIVAANPGQWRSISLRSKTARYLDKAAITLEGPIARKFAVSAGFANAIAIQNRFKMAAAALRDKVTWLATPREETKSSLARTLADELLIAATGIFDRLEYSETGQEPRTVSRIARLRAIISWVIVGVGPAVFLLVSRRVGWTDPATTAILVQFAALGFFIAILSAVDPSGYKDKLSSVTGTGSALFGWKAAETKE
jgi:hypothetical protein